MLFTTEQLALASTWGANIIYFIAIIPQILLNYNRKSAVGLSDYMLLLYLVAYIAEVYYSFCLYLPSAYRTALPLGLLAVVILCVQRIYYSSLAQSKVPLFGMTIILGLGFALLPVMFRHTVYAGNISGWVGSIIWSTYKVPQIFKIYRSKSVEGISFLFIFVLWLGGLFEAFGAIILSLPMQSTFNGIYSSVINSVLLYLFITYRKG